MSYAKLYKQAVKEAQLDNPGIDADDLENEVNEIMSRWMADIAEDSQYIEDTPCLDPEQFMSYHS